MLTNDLNVSRSILVGEDYCRNVDGLKKLNNLPFDDFSLNLGTQMVEVWEMVAMDFLECTRKKRECKKSKP